MKANYIISSEFLCIRNLSARRLFILPHAASAILLICSVQPQVLENVRPRCLCQVDSERKVLFIVRAGCVTWICF